MRRHDIEKEDPLAFVRLDARGQELTFITRTDGIELYDIKKYCTLYYSVWQYRDIARENSTDLQEFFLRGPLRYYGWNR